MPRTRPLVLAAVLLGLPATAALGQETGGSITFNLLSIEGLVVGTTVTIDADFGAEHGIAVPAAFSVLIPTADDVRELMDPAPKPGNAFAKISFATEELVLIENIQFVPFTVPGEEMQARLQQTAELMAGPAFQAATEGYAEPVRIGVRETTAGEHPAIEVIGTYQDPDLGLMYLRIVGIPNPNGPDSVFAVANVVAALEPLPSPDDFPRTRGGAALRHFDYLD